MKIFEFHFNPKGKEDFIFDSFCYEPENVYERKLGSLFLVGELKNAFPQNIKFLNNFASFLKKEYYSASTKSSPESSLKHTLKNSNQFLEEIAKSGDVSWLGNFNLAILSLKNFDLNFTKVGTVKILLLRQGQIIDVGKNLELEDFEPYPLKIFGNIVSGKLTEQDMVLVLTKEVFNFLSVQNLLKQIAQIQPFEQSKLTALLKTEQNKLLKISGICLLLLLTKEVWPKIEKPTAFTFQHRREKFSLKQVFLPLVKELSRIRLVFSKTLSRFDRFWQKFQKLKKVKLKPKIKIPRINISLRKLKIKFLTGFSPAFKKNIILVSSLIVILILGFLIFERENRAKLREYQSTLTAVHQSILQAENYLALKNEKSAFAIYKKAWEDVLPIAKEKSALQTEAVSLKNSIQQNLEEISKLAKISDPKLLFQFDEKEFIPQKMVFFLENLYFFSPLVNNIYKLTLGGEKNIIETKQKFNSAASFNSSIIFFQKPDLIFFLKNSELSEPLSLKPPYSNFNPKIMSVFRSNIYFLDGELGEIIKYPAPLTQNKDLPQFWLAEDAEKVVQAKSMAIDGPIWILNKDNSILQYYGGNFRKTITLDIFPEPENLSSIQAAYGLFYLLEPAQKRVIVLTEAGEIVKQWQSDKFNNLKHFAVSESGRTIWLLNGAKVFEISF